MSGYKNRTEFSKANLRLHKRLSENHSELLESLLPTTKRIKHSIDNCKIDALLYKRRSDWRKYSPSVYQFALKKGIVDQCCNHMKKTRRVLDYNKVKLISKKFKNRKEFEVKDNSAYCWARKNGYLEDFCKHMEYYFDYKGTTKKKEIVEFVKKYKKQPSPKSKDKLEKKLGAAVSHYCAEQDKLYDYKFKLKYTKLLNNMGLSRLSSKEKSKKLKDDYLSFIKANKYKPSRKESSRLEQGAAKYCNPCNPSYDPKFKEEVEALCKKLGIK